MARGLARGQIWIYTFRRPDKRRPVVILSRNDAIPILNTILVAAVTSTIRGLPSEVVVGTDEGLKHDSAVNLDHVYTLEQARLERAVGTLGTRKMAAVCRSLAIATGCDGGGTPGETPEPPRSPPSRVAVDPDRASRLVPRQPQWRARAGRRSRRPS